MNKPSKTSTPTAPKASTQPIEENKAATEQQPKVEQVKPVAETKIPKAEPASKKEPVATPAPAMKESKPAQAVPPATPPTAPVAAKGDGSNWLAVFALILAGIAVVFAAYMWDRLNTVYAATESFNTQIATIDASKQNAQAATTAVEAFRGELGDLKRAMYQQDQSDQIKMLTTAINELKAPTDNHFIANMGGLLTSAQIQAQLGGSATPILSTLTTFDQYLDTIGYDAGGLLRGAIKDDIQRIKDLPTPSPARLSQEINELLSAFEGSVSALPLMSDVLTTDPGLSVDVDLSDNPLTVQSTDAEATGFWDKTKAAGSWTAEKAGAAASSVWDQLGSLIRVTPIENREAVLLSPQEGLLLKENIKLRLLSARIATVQGEYEQAQKELQDVQTGINRYFDTHNAQVKELLSRIEQIHGKLNQVALPVPSATLSALKTLQAKP